MRSSARWRSGALALGRGVPGAVRTPGLVGVLVDVVRVVRVVAVALRTGLVGALLTAGGRRLRALALLRALAAGGGVLGAPLLSDLLAVGGDPPTTPTSPTTPATTAAAAVVAVVAAASLAAIPAAVSLASAALRSSIIFFSASPASGAGLSSHRSAGRRLRTGHRQ